jgi:hypothetical protein
MGLMVREGKSKVLDAIFNIVVFIVLSVILMYAFWATMQLFPAIKEAFLTNNKPTIISNPFLAHGEASFLILAWVIMVIAKWQWRIWEYRHMLEFGFQMIVGWIVAVSVAYWCATAEFETMQVMFGAREFTTVGFFWLPPLAFFMCLLPYREYLYSYGTGANGSVVQGAERGTTSEAFHASEELLQKTARRQHETAQKRHERGG